VNRVTPEIPVEGGVSFQQRDGHPTARQQQGEHHSARTAADDAAAGVVHIEDLLGAALVEWERRHEQN
jgi:hypothetical protein